VAINSDDMKILFKGLSSGKGIMLEILEEFSSIKKVPKLIASKESEKVRKVKFDTYKKNREILVKYGLLENKYMPELGNPHYMLLTNKGERLIEYLDAIGSLLKEEEYI